MGLDVVLMHVEQRGTSTKRRRLTPLAAVPDEGDVLARAFPASGLPMLSRAGPYRDLILRPAEMEQFINEAESMITGADKTCGARIREVLDLARRCKDDLSTELHLQAD